MGKVYLLRHAQSIVNVERVFHCHDGLGDLTGLGVEQARKAASWLTDKDITAIFASPAVRARQTAEIIGEALNLPVTTLDGLREVDCGDMDGQSGDPAWEAWWTIFKRWLQAEWDARYPGGETLREGYLRFVDAMNAARCEGNTVVVSHGGILRGIVPYLCVNAAALQRADLIDNTGFIVLEPYGDRRYTCESWNLLEHL